MGSIRAVRGTAVRSLQRRLHTECQGYSEMVERARCQAARELLQDSEIRITEIALDVGCSDAAHFNRRHAPGVPPPAARRLSRALAPTFPRSPPGLPWSAVTIPVERVTWVGWKRPGAAAMPGTL